MQPFPGFRRSDVLACGRPSLVRYYALAEQIPLNLNTYGCGDSAGFRRSTGRPRSFLDWRYAEFAHRENSNDFSSQDRTLPHYNWQPCEWDKPCFSCVIGTYRTSNSSDAVKGPIARRNRRGTGDSVSVWSSGISTKDTYAERCRSNTSSGAD